MATTSERAKRSSAPKATKAGAASPSTGGLTLTRLKSSGGRAGAKNSGIVIAQTVTNVPQKEQGGTTAKRSKSGRLLRTKGSNTVWRTKVFAEHYDADPMMRINIVKEGLPAKAPGEIAIRMGLSKDRMYNMLGLPRATVERKVRDQKVLSPDESARVLGVSRLIGQAQRMVEESGNPDGFDAGAWVASWIERPVPALGGRRPSELMDTAEGQALVASVLSRVQSGAYS